MADTERYVIDWIRNVWRSLNRLRIAQIPLLLAGLFGLPLVCVLIHMVGHLWFESHTDFRSIERIVRVKELSRLQYLIAQRADLGLEPCPADFRDAEATLVPLDAEINDVLIQLARHLQHRVRPDQPDDLSFVPPLNQLPSHLSDVSSQNWRDQHHEALQAITQVIAQQTDPGRHRSHPATATLTFTEFLTKRMPFVVSDLEAALVACHTHPNDSASEQSRRKFLTAIQSVRSTCDVVDLARQQAESLLPDFAVKQAKPADDEVSIDSLVARFAKLEELVQSEPSWPPAEPELYWRQVSQLRIELARFTQDSLSFTERVLHRHAVSGRMTAVIIAMVTVLSIAAIIAVVLAWRWRLIKSLSAIQNIVKTSPSDQTESLSEFSLLNEDLVPILRDRQRMASLLQSSANRAQEAVSRALQAERTARQTQEQIDLMTATSQDGLWDWDVRTDVAYFSPLVWKMLGYRPENMPQLTFNAFADQIHPDDRKAVQQARSAHLEHRQAYVCEFRLRAVNGEYRWFHERGHAKWDSQGRPVRMVGTLRDVTERRRLIAEQEKFVTDLQASRDEIAAQAAQLKWQTEQLWISRERAEVAARSKSEFLANMSHELRTPLAAILGYADLLDESTDVARAESSREDMIQSIRSNGEHLLQMIDDVLDLARIDAGHMTIEFVPCRIDEILDQARQWLDLRTKGKALEFDVRTEGLLPTVFLCDPKRLRQILLNLIGNAVKFTEQGRITVEVLIDPPASDLLHFRVTDTGVGMTPEQIARLYQPFDQADTSSSRKFGGTGLGLAISQRLAGLLGGEITVVSELNRGSAFTLSLQLNVPPGTEYLEFTPKVFCEMKSTVLRGALEGTRILVAEHAETHRRHLTFVLKQAGANVVTVDQGEAALQEVVASTQRNEPFSLILMDMQLPVINGSDAVRQLRVLGHREPIVALIPHDQFDARRLALEAGCEDCLEKPIDRVALLEVCGRYTPQPEPADTPAAQ